VVSQLFYSGTGVCGVMRAFRGGWKMYECVDFAGTGDNVRSFRMDLFFRDLR
jgi:hypothetical protein